MFPWADEIGQMTKDESEDVEDQVERTKERKPQ